VSTGMYEHKTGGGYVEHKAKCQNERP
jgi:hypothetical protein